MAFRVEQAKLEDRVWSPTTDPEAAYQIGMDEGYDIGYQDGYNTALRAVLHEIERRRQRNFNRDEGSDHNYKMDVGEASALSGMMTFVKELGNL